MPNNQQPQGLTKVITNPMPNDDDKVIIDFNMPEDNGIATASHLVLNFDDGQLRTTVDLILNPALLRTRYDSVTIDVATSVGYDIDIYILTDGSHVSDYTKAPKRRIKVDGTHLVTIKKLNDTIVFDGADIDRLIVRPAPEAGDSTGTPTPEPSAE